MGCCERATVRMPPLRTILTVDRALLRVRGVVAKKRICRWLFISSSTAGDTALEVRACIGLDSFRFSGWQYDTYDNLFSSLHPFWRWIFYSLFFDNCLTVCWHGHVLLPRLRPDSYFIARSVNASFIRSSPFYSHTSHSLHHRSRYHTRMFHPRTSSLFSPSTLPFIPSS